MTNDATAKRYATVLRLRREGLTFAKIGAAIGTTASRAGLLYDLALKHEATSARWSDEKPGPDTPIAQLQLRDRTFKRLQDIGLKTFSDVVALLESPSEFLRRPGFGRVEMRELQALVDTTCPPSDGTDGSGHQRPGVQATVTQGQKARVFGASEWEEHAKLVGAVTLSWNRNVYQLLRVFTHLTGIESPLAEAIFFSPQSDSSQRRLIERVADAVGLAAADQTALKRLLKRIEGVARGRNLAAHTIFGLSAFDPATGHWGAKVVPALAPPQDIRLQADFTAQFKKAEIDLGKIFEDLEAWLLNTPYPPRPWGHPPLPLALAREIEGAQLAADFTMTEPFQPSPGDA